MGSLSYAFRRVLLLIEKCWLDSAYSISTLISTLILKNVDQNQLLPSAALGPGCNVKTHPAVAPPPWLVLFDDIQAVGQRV